MDIIKLGYGKACITPPLGTELAGFAVEDRRATAVHDDLYARVLLLDVSSELYCFIQTDVVDLDDEYVKSIKEGLLSFGLKKDQIFLGAVHTHSGPKGTNKGVEGFTKGMAKTIGQYDEQLCNEYIKQIQKAVSEAMDNMAETTFRIANGTVSGVATNRNIKEKPGDSNLFVLEGTRADGKKVLLYNFACHPTIMNFSNTLISADLPGAVAGEFENKDYELCMFINGSCGDISTRFTKKESSFAEVERLGSILKDGIVNALKDSKVFEISGAAVDFFTLPMKVKELDTVEIAEQKLNNYKQELEKAKIEGIQPIRLYESRFEGAEHNLALSKSFMGVSSIDMTVSFFKLNDLVFVFVPGELFSDLSNPIREEFGTRVIFCGYCNGYQGYIADRASYEAQTYETLSSPFEKGQGELLMEQIKIILKQTD